MRDNARMPGRIRRSMSGAAFFASLLALLATSKGPEWSLNATITGPMTPSAERGLEITIESSAEPRIHARDVVKGPTPHPDTIPCLGLWVAGAKMSCLLPPGATLTSIEIKGDCGGCATPCVPPAGAFANVTTADAAVWTDVVIARKRVSLPDHVPDHIATPFQVRAAGARFIRVTFTATPAAGGPPLVQEEQACAFGGTGTSAIASCHFLVFDTGVLPKMDVDVVAEITGWGSCPGAKDTACAPPKTLRIDSFEIPK
jgi:hypothetical protein